MARAKPAELKGADRETNCGIARSPLNGEHGPARDIVLVNASACLVACGKAQDFREGVGVVSEALDSGAARRKLEQWVNFTQSHCVEGDSACISATARL